MYAPLPQQPPPPPPQQREATCLSSVCNARVACYLGLVLSLGLFLLLTYQTCVLCVMAIALLSLLLIQVPFMPLVFGVSMFVLLYHAVDYRNATVKVEVPLSNFVYVPTLDDVRKYVHMSTPDTAPIKAAEATPPPRWHPFSSR